jgi:predicted nuclease of restriction endonuclease-like RecB superfamily
MLTKEFIKPTFRKDRCYPLQRDPADEDFLASVEEVLSMIQSRVGDTYGLIEQDLMANNDDRFRTKRAMWKLLADAAEWTELRSPAIEELRWQAIYAAGDLRTQRSFTSLEAYREAVREHLNSDNLPEVMFSDLPENRVLLSTPPLEAPQLIARYNLAQIQGIILRAKSLEITLAEANLENLRGLFRRLKFSQLECDLSEFQEKKGLTITGPLAIFDQSQTYGFKLVGLLPAILALPKFTLKAEVDFGGKRGVLILDEKSPATQLAKAWQSYVPEEIHDSLRQLAAEDQQDFSLETQVLPLNLGHQLRIVPDFFLKPKGADQSFPVELFHKWHAGSLEARVKGLQHSPQTLLALGVDKALTKNKQLKNVLASETFLKHGFIFNSFPTAKNLRLAIDLMTSVAEGRSATSSPTKSARKGKSK